MTGSQCSINLALHKSGVTMATGIANYRSLKKMKCQRWGDSVHTLKTFLIFSQPYRTRGCCGSTKKYE